ncbi:MAG TPA: hypothetical protein VFV50_02680 [Bdellovibrionales bacterium]|nr:hypothetical protein [Bdellovibrionales bacterium]
MKKFAVATAVLLALSTASGSECTEQDLAVFDQAIAAREKQKFNLSAWRYKATVTGVRIDKDKGGRRFEGALTANRVYTKKSGAKYTGVRFTGDKSMNDGPLWAPGPLKVFIEQDEQMNAPVRTRADAASKISSKLYKVVSCEMGIFNEKLGQKVHRFTVAPKAATEGLFEGYLDADPETLLTMSEVSTKVYLSGKATGKLGGRMKEFNFERLFKVVDGVISVPFYFKTHATSGWGQYSDVTLEAKFELIDYKYDEAPSEPETKGRNRP